jgi:hypothetical protein
MGSTFQLRKAIANNDGDAVAKMLTDSEHRLFLKVVRSCKKCFGRGFVGTIGDQRLRCKCVTKAFTMILRDRGRTGDDTGERAAPDTSPDAKLAAVCD